MLTFFQQISHSAPCPTASLTSLPGTLCHVAEESFAHTCSKQPEKHSNCATPKARTRTGLEPQDELVTMVGELCLFVKEDWWKVKNPLGTKTYYIPDCFPHQMERMLQFHFLPQTNHSMHVYTIITPTHPSMTKMKNSTRYTHFFPLKGRTNHT